MKVAVVKERRAFEHRVAASPDTVKRDWRLAKLWLLRELGGDAG